MISCGVDIKDYSLVASLLTQTLKVIKEGISPLEEVTAACFDQGARQRLYMFRFVFYVMDAK